MTRVKRGVTSRKKHKRELKRAKGYRGTRSKLIKKARESVLHAGAYAFRDRRSKRRQFRRLWILRINAALGNKGLSYSKAIHTIDEAGIKLNRKMLALLASEYPTSFDAVIKEAGL